MHEQKINRTSDSDSYKNLRILVVDDDPDDRELVRLAAPPGAIILEADNGLDALDLVRQEGRRLSLVVLDLNMPGLDGYDTCLRLRELNPLVPILPFTGDDSALPFLVELRCAPPVIKPVKIQLLTQRICEAVNLFLPPPRQTGLLWVAQRKAAERESQAREGAVIQRVAIFANSPLIRGGLQRLVRAAGVPSIREAATSRALRQVLGTMAVRIVVTAAHDWPEIASLVHDYQKPVLLVARSLIEALTVREPDGMLIGRLTEQDTAHRGMLAEALTSLAQGEPYTSPAIATPFAGLDLTPQKQHHLLLEAQQYTAEEIARELGVTIDTVYQYRRRLCDKLGLQKTDELSAYARDLLARRERIPDA